MRLKIALRNLIISQALIFVFIIFAYYVWFPYSFSMLGGFYKTALMLLFVDLVLGPLLVFIVFKEGKAYLKFDINVLLTIQIIAFVYGAHSLYLKHPAYAVFNKDKFILTNLSSVYPQPSWSSQINQYLFSSPNLVVTKLPKDDLKRDSLILDVILSGKPDIDSRPEFFTPFEQDALAIMDKGIDIKKIATDNLSTDKINQFLTKHNSNINDLAFFPLSGNNKKHVIWAFNKTTAKPVGIIDIDPWKLKVASNLSTN